MGGEEGRKKSSNELTACSRTLIQGNVRGVKFNSQVVDDTRDEVAGREEVEGVGGKLGNVSGNLANCFKSIHLSACECARWKRIDDLRWRQRRRAGSRSWNGWCKISAFSQGQGQGCASHITPHSWVAAPHPPAIHR